MKSKRILNSALILGFGLLVNAQVVNADETKNVVDSEVVNSSSISDSQVSDDEQTDSDSTTIQNSADVVTSEPTTGNAILSTQESESTTSDETKNDVTPSVTPRASVNSQSGYINVPGVGWRWLENGQNFTGFRKYMGSYYWFQNGVRQENSWEMAWGNKYYVGADGRAVQGIVTINGQKYDFGKNNTFYLRGKVTMPTNKTGYINVPGVGWRWLENGQNFTGFRKYMGSYYWFQNGVRQENSWETAWGNKYYVGADGRAVQGIVTINGQKYNFGKNNTFYLRGKVTMPNKTGYINVPGIGWRWLEKGQNFTGFRKYMGSYYWFQDGVRQENKWETAWGYKYYVGADGRAVQGIVTINGQKHNFGKNGTFYERPMPIKVNRPTYFSQWDNRWANTWLSGGTFGATGCVPTSAAMVLKGSYVVNVTPRQVGNQVSKFHEAYGASGLDLQTMVNAYGHSAKSLSTPNAVKNELKQGKPVIFFVNVGIGHAVVGYGYNQGKTEIFDPYNQQFYKGWNSVDGVLGRLSQDPQDWDAGTPAFVIN
ncbi:C39 family peptidase [Weissella bombi]|uniref:Glucan-binding domain-containing protein (YG repeat) n=1 Tax=Weissella bombi TaxID=1505725 RepID=A0A1C3Z857_9LACO|nr:C39 family peptidase [Weissella bombi]SCB78506.1 Glucan-binding domain-containing protein (YG repeat) [Weissella bombi]